MKNSSTARGFTLIELLIVVAIIGLLSSIVLAALNQGRRKAKIAAEIQSVRQLETALHLYRTDHDDFPPVDHGVSGPIANHGQASIFDLSPYLTEKYMPGFDYNNTPAVIYIHACNETTPCHTTGLSNNHSLMMNYCGNYSSTTAVLVVNITDGPVSAFQYGASTHLYSANENHICLN